MEKQIESNLYFTVKSEFFMANQFQKMTEKSKRGCIIFDNFCQSLENYYLSYKLIYDNLYESIKINPYDKSAYIKQFKAFLDELTSLIKNVSVFQVDCLTQIRTFKQSDLDEATESLTSKIDDIKETQDLFLQKYAKLQTLEDQLKTCHSKLQHQSRQPILFYNQKHMQHSKKHIEQLIEKREKKSLQLSSQIKIVTENSQDFQRYLSFYKKKLFMNKYKYINKLFEMSKSSRECLTELLVLVSDCLMKKHKQFRQLMKAQLNGSQKMKIRRNSRNGQQGSDNIACQIITMTQEYTMMIEEIEGILNLLIESLTQVANVGRIQYQKSKDNFLDHMNKIYEIYQNPSAYVIDSLDLFNYFTQKFAGIADKLFLCAQDFSKLKQNVKKHSDITLSLLKCGSQKAKVLNAKSLNTQSPRHINFLDDLIEQMSPDFVNAIMDNVYQSFNSTFSELKHYFNSKYYKKKKNYIEDSMEISHIQEQQPVFEKRPAKHQKWLWSEWKNFKLSINQQTELANQINSDLKRIKFLDDGGKLIEKYNCVFATKKQYKGIIKILQKEVQFSSYDNSTHIRIALNHIDEVTDKIRIFEKILIISTQAGEISVSKIMGDAQQVKQNIQNQMTTAGAQLGCVKNEKRTVSKLSESEQRNMQAWRQKVKGSIEQDQLTFKTVEQIIIPNVTIDHVYELVLSDKPTTIKGKQYSCFYEYVVIKNKNFNVKCSKYSPSGPKFYTQNQQVNFESSPICSQRVVQFDHPIPPIPFMPKSVHIKETMSTYWVSNQELVTIVNATQSGAPYTQNFVVKIMFKANKVENGVKLGIYGKVVNVVDFSMRRMIQAKAKSQMQENCRFTITEQARYIKSITSANKASNNILDSLENDKKGQVQRSTQVSQQIQKKQNRQMQKLKKQNKMLIVGFVSLIVINIILNTFFGR